MEITRKQLAEKLLQDLHSEEGGNHTCDTPALLNSLEGESLQLHQLPIKIISILGGLLSAILFTGFLLVLGLWESGSALALFGVFFMGASVLVINQLSSTYLSATAIAFLFIGLMLFGAGLGISLENISVVCLGLMLAAAVLCLATSNNLVLFVLTLVFLVSSLVLVLQAEIGVLLPLFVILQAALLLGWCLAETTLISAGNRLNTLYLPLRTGLIVGFGFLMAFLASPETSREYGVFSYPWLAGVGLLLALFCFVLYLHRSLKQAADPAGRSISSLICLPLLMVPLVLAPAVIGGFLLILLGFYLRHLSSLVVGIIAFCYSLFLFYYDLQLSLLEKSGMLLLSGGWFLLAYFLLKRYAN